MRFWRRLFRRGDPAAIEERRRRAEELARTEEHHIRATREIREDLERITERIRRDDCFPFLGRRRVTVNRKTRP